MFEGRVNQARSLFLRSVGIIVPYCVVFFSFLLFDTLGAAEGWQVAISMPVTIVVVTMVLWCVSHYCTQTGRVLSNNEEASGNDGRLTLDFDYH